MISAPRDTRKSARVKPGKYHGFIKAKKRSRGKGRKWSKNMKGRIGFWRLKENLYQPAWSTTCSWKNLQMAPRYFCQAFPNLSGLSLFLGPPGKSNTNFDQFQWLFENKIVCSIQDWKGTFGFKSPLPSASIHLLFLKGRALFDSEDPKNFG